MDDTRAFCRLKEPRNVREQSEKLEKAQVQRIIAALDDKCRDVEF
jgi:hypothetical protein